MQEHIRGTFHFHSTYSHDGRSTLDEIVSRLYSRNFSFCIMTEHFEDLNPQTFDRYVQEVDTLNRRGAFVLIPGIEVNLSGIDTIVFPVRDYSATARFASAGEDRENQLFKVVAHPSKYRFEAVVRHLDKYEIDGIELWNQQADGHYVPPLGLLAKLRQQAWRHRYRYLFGCDLHDVTLAVANIVSVRRPHPLTAHAVVTEIRSGEFLAHNLTTGIEYNNGVYPSDLDSWADTVLDRRYYSAALLRSVRYCLQRAYRLLPRDARHSLNDFKNLVRNKI